MYKKPQTLIKRIMFILTVVLIIGAVVCDEDATQSPDYQNGKFSKANGINPGAARQIYGSGSLRPPGPLSSTQKPQISSPDDIRVIHRPSLTHGILITEPFHHGQPPPLVPQSPFDASYRAVGGVRVPGGFAIPIPPGIGVGRSSDIYGPRDFGERHGDLTVDWSGRDRVPQTHIHHGHMDGFVPEHSIVDPESELMEDGGSDDNQCMISCESWEFLCITSCICINKNARCDGNVDCQLREDEQNCQDVNEENIKEYRNNCESTGLHIMCPRTYACIAKAWLCDGDDDCGDFSDETHCGARGNCSEDQFECQNGLCIQQSWTCDGDNDCKDFSDETNCTKLSCTPQEFQCAEGSCISLSFRCDDDSDCPDGSDEHNCNTPMPPCPEGEFKCKESTDEVGSPGRHCILQRFRCDGDNDCGDWSDEESCPKKLTSCATNEFKCDDGSCILGRWRCDTEYDCEGGEDEKGCTGSGKDGARTCAPDEYTCKDGRCILKSWVCDGAADCKRGEDELDCEVHCEVGQFSCPPHKNSSNVKICVNQKHVCDSHNDCPGGEDELNCPAPRHCGSNSKCEQLCIVTSKGRDECACRVGFTLHANGYNCTDIDECLFASNPVCSQKCINTVGSFRCSCVTGYILRPDLRTCKALGGAMKLIMANRADIRQVALSNNKYTSIIKGLHNAIALDYHFKKELLFWSDVSTDVIKKSYLNGTVVRDVIKWGLESPGGVAVDWIHDLLFWTDSGTRRVEVATFDGLLRAVIASSDLDKPRAIVAHPGEALVFWSDWGPNPKIERAFMDGSERKTIITDGVFWPNGLALDYPANRMYWADAKHHIVESANFDGSDRKKVLSNHLPHPFALTLFEDSLFWTDWHTKSISTANKITGKGFRNVHENLHFPMDIHSYHPARQPNYKNRCAYDHRGMKGGCSHLCLPNKNSRRCGCPIGLTLKEDQKTCTSVPNKLLLVARKKDIRLRQLDPLNASIEIDMVVPLDGLKSTVALDWCSQSNYIYWTDVGRVSISRAFLNGSNQETIIQANLVTPAGLALDWVTNKLYWTDPGTNRIEVSSTDGKKRALLIWQGLDKPRDIVVNPIDGLMFWSDLGKTALIERAGMDASDRRVLVSEGILWPNGLAVERSSNRLYFIDGGTKSFEYINFDGTGRKKIITSGLQHPFGLDIFENKVYWTDWDSHSVEEADKLTGRNRRSVISNISDLMEVRVFHRDRKFIHNPCSMDNGGCSHICLLNPSGYTCVCPIGVKLTSNNRTCNDGPTSYVIFAHRIDIRQISLDIDYKIDVILPLPPISNAVAVDVDRKTGDIYWSDTTEDVIKSSSVDGTHINLIIGESMESVDGLVIDSTGRKIYWSDAGRHTIEVSELDGNNRNVLIWQDLESPRGIAISYDHGYLFWTDWGSYPKIERSFMDGERRSKIVTAKLVWPNALSVDAIKQRVYWTDAQLNHIDSCDFDGNSRKLVLNNLPHPYGLSVSGNTIYWTDWMTKALHVASLTNTTQQSKLMEQLEGLMDVKIINDKDTLPENVCHNNNGGCSHLCLRRPNGFSCKCPTGIKLKPDSTKECESLPENYLLVALRTGIGRISLDTPKFFDVVLPTEGVFGSVVLDYNYNKSSIFYADVNIDAIKSIDMENPSKSKTIISSGLNTPNGIAVDWSANNLYWTDTGLKVMEVARLNGTSRKIILKENLNDPRAMILYPKRGFIFWADWGQPPRIERCYMDGSDRKMIIDSNLGFPNGLAIDFETRKLYWADALEDKIEFSDFDGKNRTTIVPHAPHPFGVTLFASYIYWTDWYNKSVFRASKLENSNPEEVRHGLRGALEIRSVSKLRQPYYYTPCTHENGGCTHLCLFREKSYICACPDKDDGRTCKTEPAFHVPLRQPGSPEETTEYVTDSNPDHDPNYATTASHAQAVIIATCILSGLLIVVLIAILILVFNSRRKKGKRTPSGSSRSMLTFTNPNYNIADGQPHPETAPSSKNTIWKRLKYDKSQERVYEEKCIGGSETATTTLIAPTPSPMPSPSAIVTLPTIG